jgi:hypothetical protein
MRQIMGGRHLFARVTRAGAKGGVPSPPLAPALVNARLMQKLDAHPQVVFLLLEEPLCVTLSKPYTKLLLYILVSIEDNS